MDLSSITLETAKSMRSLPEGGYTVSISTHLHERLGKHVMLLKKLVDRSANKQRWVLDAIRRKLQKEEKQQEVPVERRLTLKIDKSIDKELIKRVEFIKQFRTSYSKKQWILDAIIEQLDIEEKVITNKISEMQK